MKHGRAGPPRPPPRAQAGHERRATIHDLPSHVLAHRVAAHLSAADAARLMQAAGRVHRGDLGHVMGQRKREMIEKPAEDIVRIMNDMARKGQSYVSINTEDFQGIPTSVFARDDVQVVAPGPLTHPFGGNPKNIAHVSVLLKSGGVYVATLQFGERILDPFPDITRRAAPRMAFAYIDDDRWKTAGKNPETAVELFREITKRWSGGMDVVVVEKHGREGEIPTPFDAHLEKHPGKIVLWIRRDRTQTATPRRQVKPPSARGTFKAGTRRGTPKPKPKTTRR